MHASFIPLVDSESCQYISGFSGFPKFKLSVIAMGFAPVHETFLAASQTAIFEPK